MTADTNEGASHSGEHIEHAQDAGRDESIVARLKADPANPEAKLDRGLDESMDASDPPSTSQPSTNSAPPVSSGYDADAERKLQDEKSA
ncbi:MULTISPECIES: hypothetical protein [unclassified Sphingomonas]|uniref:hypothetical protein n=1 Tax=unclassified Sphingomonas TaxID=196159 RepID=UPI001F56D8D2|nr:MULTISPECIES: hypothetical protein [unclassified Sphingomonas]